MSTRTNALVDHRVADSSKTEAVIEFLAPTLADCRAVQDYWSSIEPSETDNKDSWTSRLHHNPPEEDFVWYYGPGGLSIRFGLKVAIISALCRWRGFLSLEQLQQVQVRAFRSIARALGGSQVVMIPDDDGVEAMANYDGATLNDCQTALRRKCGPPRIRTVIGEGDTSLESPACWKVWNVESIYDELPDAGRQIAEHTI